MKKTHLLLVLLSIMAVLFMGCPEPDSPKPTPPGDTRVALTAGQSVSVLATATTANVTFTGAAGLVLLNTDFTVTTGGTISSVTNSGGTATVAVTFAANTSNTQPKTYTVGISATSTVIKGEATVVITQQPSGPAELTAGEHVGAGPSHTSAVVTFTGPTGLTGLTASDFTVTTGATITTVSVQGGTISVTVTFAINESETEEVTYTVGISSESTLIRGDATVDIIQGKKTKVELNAGEPTHVKHSALSGVVTFIDPSDPSWLATEDLATTDFTASTGATITSVTAAEGIVSVTVTLSAANNDIDNAKTYTIGISASSNVIKGSATTTITQGKAPRPIPTAVNYIRQDFERTSTSSTWTKLDGNAANGGGLVEVLADDPAGGSSKVGSYSGTGTGDRATALNFVPTNLVTGDIVVAEFDWYPGSLPSSGSWVGPFHISLNDGRSTTASVHGNKIISFINQNSGALKYRIGPFGDGDSALTGAVDIPGTEDKSKWYTFQVAIDFVENTVSKLTVKDRATGVELFADDGLDLGATNYNRAIRTIRLFLNRVDTNTYNFFLDNVFVGDGNQPPPDSRELLVAGADILVKPSATTAVATFTGDATYLVEDLAAEDFTVSTGGTITDVVKNSGTVSVTVTFDANTSNTVNNTYTVGISPDSTKVRGTSNVTITQPADAPVELTAGPAVSVTADAITGTVTFTGASWLETADLATTDFTADNSATVTGVTVSTSRVVSVTVSFAANSSPTNTNAYVVGINGSSTKVKGSATVTITQAKYVKILTAGPAVFVENSATSGIAIFNGATSLTNGDPTAADFTVTSGGTISNYNFESSSGVITITVSFAAGSPAVSKTYTVGISQSSDKVGGSATVAITQTKASFLETFDDSSNLVFTTVGGSIGGGTGGITQTVANGIATYAGTGSGARGIALNFKPENTIVSGDNMLYVNFDWAPIGAASFSGRGPASLSINANSGGTTGATAANGNKIITFIVNRAANDSHALYYRIDNFTAVLADYNVTTQPEPADPAVKIIDTTNMVNVWYNINIIINFAADTFSFTITPKAGGDPVGANDLTLNDTVKDANRVGGFLLNNNRVDGTWVPALDNIYVGANAKP